MLLYGSTLTYMGLALMIGWLKSMHWIAASAIFFVIALTMFLLPPVPGLAVYLCAGVLLTPVTEPVFGYAYACLYAAFFAVFIKNVAQVLQQKLIGERLGSSASVKSAVGINSDLIKAIRHILQQRGLTLAKVAILCSGPDWPTAVLCGILKLDVTQMLIGLLPIFTLTAPSSLAASFQLRVPEGGAWEPLASMMLMLAALVQLVAMCIALYYIDQVKNDASALCADDEEVAEVEQAEAKAAAVFTELTRLGPMPLVPKTLLISGMLTMTASVYLLLFFGGRCFEEFALTDDVASVLCLSCERAPVKPLGWIAFALLAYAICCLVIFKRWANARVRAHLAGMSAMMMW